MAYKIEPKIMDFLGPFLSINLPIKGFVKRDNIESVENRMPRSKADEPKFIAIIGNIKLTKYKGKEI